jgi:transposase
VRVTTVFNRVLKLPGTRVTDVRLEAETIVVTVARRKRSSMCPCGATTAAVYDRSIRRWRHLDACGTRIVLEAAICRIRCRRCARVRTEQVPWARSNARHTRAFENVVLWCARRMDKTAVAELLRVAWSTVDSMIARAAGDPAALGRLDGLRRIGVDEISYKHGHKYLTIVVDHDSGDVVWAAEGKNAATLTAFYDLLGPDRCARLEAVSMDFGLAFKTATERAAPQARICGDPFHLLKLASETVDTVRRRTLKDIKDPQVRWALLKRPDHLNVRQQQLLDQLANDETDAWRAWAQREQLRAVLHTPPERAVDAVDAWLTDAAASTVVPIRNLARRLHNHRQLIINTIELRLSNGRLEGTNSKIRLLNHRGYGHHRAAALIALILLACRNEQR